MTDLQKLHKLVHDFRAEMKLAGSEWVHPPPKDCLRYAFTEVAEALDAFMRLNRPIDARNNERELSVHAELADTAIMLWSAVPKGAVLDYPEWVPPNISGELDLICSKIGDCMDGLYVDDPVSMHYTTIAFALGLIAAYPGMNLDAEVKRRLYRIAHKHLPQEKAFELVMCDLYEIGFAD